MSEASSLLEYAVGKIGRAELAARLKVPERLVAEWLDGSADMTSSKALALADLIQHREKQIAAGP